VFDWTTPDPGILNEFVDEIFGGVRYDLKNNRLHFGGHPGPVHDRDPEIFKRILYLLLRVL